MAKMLGQDILTQEEFDTFKAGSFDPLTITVADIAIANKASSERTEKYAKVATLLSVISLLGTLGLAFLIVMH